MDITAGIIGGVLGVLTIIAMAIILAVSAILCLIKKGIIIKINVTHIWTTKPFRILDFIGFLHPIRVNRLS